MGVRTAAVKPLQALVCRHVCAARQLNSVADPLFKPMTSSARALGWHAAFLPAAKTRTAFTAVCPTPWHPALASNMHPCELQKVKLRTMPNCVARSSALLQQRHLLCWHKGDGWRLLSNWCDNLHLTDLSWHSRHRHKHLRSIAWHC